MSGDRRFPCPGYTPREPAPPSREQQMEACLREALSKNGPRAHAAFCEDGSCWMCRARALLGIEEGA